MNAVKVHHSLARNSLARNSLARNSLAFSLREDQCPMPERVPVLFTRYI
jgi:hypothetical protein